MSMVWLSHGHVWWSHIHYPLTPKGKSIWATTTTHMESNKGECVEHSGKCRACTASKCYLEAHLQWAASKIHGWLRPLCHVAQGGAK